jgi:hypothetical protein
MRGDSNVRFGLVCDRGECEGLVWVSARDVDVTTSGHTDRVCGTCRGPMVQVETSYLPALNKSGGSDVEEK